MLKRKVLTFTLCGALALSLGACTNRAGKGTVENRGIKTNQVRPYGVNRLGTNNDMNLGTNQRLGGNGTIDGRLGIDNVDRNRLNFNRWDNRRGNNIVSMHNNTRIDMNRDLERRINKIKGVRNAYVALTDNNAYVAVKLTRNAPKQTRRIGTMGAVNRDGMVRGSTNNGLGMNAKTYRTRGVHPKTVSIVGNDVSDSMKSLIAERVHAVRPDIDNIYISVNPDFVGRMRGYADKVQKGRPISGLIIEFNTLVDRVFPSRTNYDMGTTRIGR